MVVKHDELPAHAMTQPVIMAMIYKFGSVRCARVLVSNTVLIESIPSEYQKVELQSAADKGAIRHQDNQISLLFFSSSIHHPLFYPSLLKLILAFLRNDDTKLYIMELGTRIKKESVYCVDNYSHRLFFKAYICILVDIELPIITYPVYVIWVQGSLYELISSCCGPFLSTFGSMSWCKDDGGECHKHSSFYDNSGTPSSMISCWVYLCAWRLGSEFNTRSEILIICHAILRHWLLASNFRPPILQPFRRCSVLYWTLDNLYVTHDKHYMNSKEWIRVLYVCNDHFNLILEIGFFICSTELRKGTFFPHLLVMDGCWLFSRPWGLCINSDYAQLPFLCQVWARLCVTYHQPCYQMGCRWIYLSTTASVLPLTSVSSLSVDTNGLVPHPLKKSMMTTSMIETSPLNKYLMYRPTIECFQLCYCGLSCSSMHYVTFMVYVNNPRVFCCQETCKQHNERKAGVLAYTWPLSKDLNTNYASEGLCSSKAINSNAFRPRIFKQNVYLLAYLVQAYYVFVSKRPL